MKTTVTLLQRRRTKIVATLGPASNDPAQVRALLDAGVDVFRLNMSHGDHVSHRHAYEMVRAAARDAGKPAAVLADLCGPKIRTGRFAGGRVELTDGEQVTITTRDVIGGPALIPSQYAGLATDVRPGCRVLIADGLLELVVDRVDGAEVQCTVVHGGPLSDRKGINLPDVEVSAPPLTPQDEEDARFAIDLGVDYLALSFVKDATDVEKLRALVGDCAVKIIAKIERPGAVEVIEEIIEASDAIMVARGDLGVELPAEAVPVIQRELISLARSYGKPVIVATQMLESMIEHPQPTRAEVSDVSTAVFSSADAVMLSAETAAGAFPVRAVEMMDRIARRIEASQWAEGVFRIDSVEPREEIPMHAAVARSTAQLSRDLRVRAIITLDRDLTAARVVASARPAAPLIVVSDDASACRQANLLWGVLPIYLADAVDDPIALARRLAMELGLAKPGQFILLVTGLGPGAPSDTAPAITALRT